MFSWVTISPGFPRNHVRATFEYRRCELAALQERGQGTLHVVRAFLPTWYCISQYFQTLEILVLIPPSTRFMHQKPHCDHILENTVFQEYETLLKYFIRRVWSNFNFEWTYFRNIETVFWSILQRHYDPTPISIPWEGPGGGVGLWRVRELHAVGEVAGRHCVQVRRLPRGWLRLDCKNVF